MREVVVICREGIREDYAIENDNRPKESKGRQASNLNKFLRFFAINFQAANSVAKNGSWQRQKNLYLIYRLAVRKV